MAALLALMISAGVEAQMITDSIQYRLALGGFAGVPGQTVRMPVKVKNQEALAGFLLRVEYDTTLLGPVELGVDENVVWDSLEMVGRGLRTMSIGSRYPGGPIDTVYNTYAIHNPGDDSINAGALFIYFIPLDLMIDQTRPHLPPESGAPTAALHLLFQVREEADPGQTAVIRIRNYDGPLFEPRFVQMVDSVLYRTIIPGSGPEYASAQFVVLAGKCGDINNDGIVNLIDVTVAVSYLFRGETPPVTPRFADVNNDGRVNILDATYLIRYLVKDGPAPLGGCLD